MNAGTAGSNPALSVESANPGLAGFEPPKGVGKEFSHVVGVTRASRASKARGAEPLWKSAFADLGSNPALSVFAKGKNGAIENRK